MNKEKENALDRWIGEIAQNKTEDGNIYITTRDGTKYDGYFEKVEGKFLFLSARNQLGKDNAMINIKDVSHLSIM